MKPARSPRFQSAAERASIAPISACGSPSGTRGAEQPASTAVTTHHVPRTTHLLLFGRQNVPCTMADATPRLWHSMVFGPVRSRRLGTSLGLNLTPRGSKLCTFDCPYCECGFNTPQALHSRWPSPDEV